MHESSLITLTTDFGPSSPYIAAMKGTILSIHGEARIVDLTHAIPAQDVRAAAWTLDDVAERFPAGTIHVVVVDPGVGTERRIVYAEINRRRYVAPDNGCLCRLARRNRPRRIIALCEPEFWLPQPSATFHGRDIMAPVAARLCLGLDPARLGSPQPDLLHIEWPEVLVLPGKIQGAVRSVDSFGNLITDISAEMLAGCPTDERVQIECDEHITQGVFRTYADQPEMTFIALVGSSGFLELAIVGDNAAEILGIRSGAVVTLTW